MRYLFSFYLVFLSYIAFGQISLSGYVYDANTNEALPGASLMIHELSKSTATDIDGRFTFSGLRPAVYHLHVTYVGYQSEIVKVQISDNTQTLRIELTPTSIELQEIIVESNHYKTGPKEQSLAVEIIDAEFLRQNRKGTLINTIERIPGVSAINTGVGISKPVIRGLGFNRVIVNDKGVKQEGQQWGTDHGLEIDMFEPGRIEVIKGPNSLMYGSDGLGGVINILPPPLPVTNKLKGEFQSVYKTNNNAISSSSMLEGIKDDIVYRSRFSTQDFGDYRVPAESFTYNNFELQLYDERLKNTAGIERSFTGMVGVKKDWGYSTLTVSNYYQKAGLFVGAIGIPRSYQLTPDGDRRNVDLPRQRINHFKIISNSNILFGKHWLELDIGYQVNSRKEESLPHAHGKGPRPEGILAHGLYLQTSSLNARYFMHFSDRHTRIIGLQGQHQINNREGFEFLLPEFISFSIGSFIYEEISWANKFTANAGLRYDFATNNIDRFNEPIYSDETTIERYYQRNSDISNNFNNFSSAVGLSYYPTRNLNAKLNLGTSFKVPTPAELSMNGIHHGTFRHEMGDSTLTSERGYQADLSFSFQRSDVGITISPFVSLFNNFIYLAPTAQFSSSLDPLAFPEGGQVYKYRQHDTFFTGGEVSVEYHPIEQLHFRSGFEYVYNYNLDTKLPLPFTPPASVFSELSYEFSALEKPSEFRIGFNHRYAFDQNRVDRNERKTPGYHLFGFTVAGDIPFRSQKVNFVFSADNLFDVRYFNHLSRYRLINLPEQGRNFVISIHIPFAIK